MQARGSVTWCPRFQRRLFQTKPIIDDPAAPSGALKAQVERRSQHHKKQSSSYRHRDWQVSLDIPVEDEKPSAIRTGRKRISY